MRSNGQLAVAPPATDAVRTLLRTLGENPDRDGLRDTPRRVTAALMEMTRGYAMDAGELLDVQFAQDGACYEGIVAVRDVPFTSMCEHHLMPFAGTAAVAYIPEPGAPLVGLSKLARLVDVYALRLQQQERMTVQIVSALEEHLSPLASACVIRAEHSCMGHRGARKPGATMVTSELRGLFFADVKARDELMALVGYA